MPAGVFTTFVITFEQFNAGLVSILVRNYQNDLTPAAPAPLFDRGWTALNLPGASANISTIKSQTHVPAPTPPQVHWGGSQNRQASMAQERYRVWIVTNSGLPIPNLTYLIWAAELIENVGS